MKRFLYYTIVFWLLGWTPQLKGNETKTNEPNELSKGIKSKTCEKCNFEAIKHAIDSWDKLTKKELESFLCSFDFYCEWPSDLMETKDEGVAYEMLVVILDRYFYNFLEIIKENESINRDYLIQLFSRPAIFDLPYNAILTKLERIEDKTEFETLLLKAFEQSLQKVKK